MVGKSWKTQKRERNKRRNGEKSGNCEKGERATREEE